MRITVSHTDPEHPNAGKFAYRLGRVQSGTDFITGEDRSAEDSISKLLEAAKKEYPESEGYAHQVERLVDHGETAEWKPVSDVSESAPEGSVQEVTLDTSTQPQTAPVY